MGWHNSEASVLRSLIVFVVSKVIITFFLHFFLFWKKGALTKETRHRSSGRSLVLGKYVGSEKGKGDCWVLPPALPTHITAIAFCQIPPEPTRQIYVSDGSSKELWTKSRASQPIHRGSCNQALCALRQESYRVCGIPQWIETTRVGAISRHLDSCSRRQKILRDSFFALPAIPWCSEKLSYKFQ